ncbi:MAG: ATP12 family chaperone protein [Alphaproteobacteria bacterium]|nr:ATP12 family chaperone protein [Alphaproteobacteria bacterium]
MKRFYKIVSIENVDSEWKILLDGKIVRTPMRSELTIPTERLAAAIQTEWQDQNEMILPDTMPITQMMMTIIDRIRPNREKFLNEALGYLDTDLICYFADEPEIYAAEQKKHWLPILNWLRDFLKCEILTTNALAALAQPQPTHKVISDYISNLNELKFSVLYLTTLTTGSVLLPIAFIENAFTENEIFDATLAEDLIKDKIYLAETYGISPDQERRRKIVKNELSGSRQFLDLCL